MTLTMQRATLVMPKWLAIKHGLPPSVSGYVEHETDRAILFRPDDGEMFWAPKSVASVVPAAEPKRPTVRLDFPVRLPLYDHQIEAASRAMQLGSIALLMEQGTGKTPVAVAVAAKRYEAGEIQRALVVAPKSVLPVWEREFRTFCAVPYAVRVLEGSIEDRCHELGREWPDGLQVAITNYESIWRTEMEEALTDFVKGQMLICDEAHRIKTPSANQSKAAHRLSKAASYRMVLTGTPVTQGPLDYYAILRCVDERIVGRSYYAFRSRYARMGGYGGYQVVGYQNLDELIDKVDRISYRVTRAECLTLPPEIHTTIPVMLGRKGRETYEALRRQLVLELGQEDTVSTTNVLAELLRLQQIAGGFLGTDSGNVVQVDDAKLSTCLDLLEDLLADKDRKVVIFCRFVAEIRALTEAMEKAGIPCGALFGETKNRGELVRAFQEDESPRVMVVQIQTGGLGITLHRSDTAVFYSTGWSLADFEQAKARIQRAGQTAERVAYYYLAAAGTVDEEIYAALQSKRDLARSVVDDWRGVLEARL